jgi:DHA1 family bicyclomycin/chloramphenicol resistance-like MFS transporter
VDQAAAKRLHDDTSGAARAPLNLLLLLMAMTAIGPTSLNILVPAVPQLSRQLGAEIATLQLTVSLFLIGLGGAQLVMGPLSDRFGRRPVLLAGLALTTLSSLAAIVLSTAEGLIAARILQAIGASTGVVVGRAIIRDLFDRSRAASVIGLVATVMVVVPTFGPLIGGVLDTAFGWEAIFLFTAVSSLLVLAWVAITLPETRGLNIPAGEAPAGFRRDLGHLAGSRSLWGYVLVAALGSSTFFAFLGGGPHVIVTLMGRSSAEYGIWFAISSIGYMAGNFCASRLTVRHGIDRMILWGIIVEAIGVLSATLLAATAHHWGPAIVFMPQLIVSLGNGLLLPGAIAGAVSIRPQAAGTAAGITGCAQMALGAVITQFSGMMLAGATSAVPMAMLMVVLAVALALSFALLVGRKSS